MALLLPWSVGAQRIVTRSIEKRGFRYTGFYGDGDGKAYPSVKDTYGVDSVIKFECIGHYQKRVGNRLRKFKKRKGIESSYRNHDRQASELFRGCP